MEGDQHTTGTRVLIAAAFFACGAFVVLLLVWQWPQWFGMGPDTDGGAQQEFSDEEKAQILQELGRSSDENDMTAAQQQAAIESVSASRTEPDESGFTQQEKIDILNSLNAQ